MFGDKLGVRAWLIAQPVERFGARAGDSGALDVIVANDAFVSGHRPTLQ
jgi:hypothetical protein